MNENDAPEAEGPEAASPPQLQEWKLAEVELTMHISTQREGTAQEGLSRFSMRISQPLPTAPFEAINALLEWAAGTFGRDLRVEVLSGRVTSTWAPAGSLHPTMGGGPASMVAPFDEEV